MGIASCGKQICLPKVCILCLLKVDGILAFRSEINILSEILITKLFHKTNESSPLEQALETKLLSLVLSMNLSVLSLLSLLLVIPPVI